MSFCSSKDIQDAIDKCLTTTGTDEVVELLSDYGIKDISILKYILDQYQKVIVNITNGRMSYLTYPAETILSVASDIYNEDFAKLMKKQRKKLQPSGTRGEV